MLNTTNEIREKKTMVSQFQIQFTYFWNTQQDFRFGLILGLMLSCLAIPCLFVLKPFPLFLVSIILILWFPWLFQYYAVRYPVNRDMREWYKLVIHDA